MNRTIAVAAVALIVLGAVIAFAVLRGAPESPAATSASPSESQALAASPSPSLATTATPPGSSSAVSGVRPDAQHGLITFTNIRTEADPRDLQQPPYFARTARNDFSVAVSPDGKRVAMLVSGETGTSLITFTTARPNDVTRMLDFSVSGEVAGQLVWAGDGSDYVVYSADKRAGSAITYSALRSVDLAAKKESEIARVTNGLHIVPLAWRFSTHIGGAVDVDSSTGKIASYYVIRDDALTDRTPFTGPFNTQITASRDGMRVAAIFAPAVRWWPVDQPAAAKELVANSSGRAEYAAFRPGRDELGVSVLAATVSQGVPPPGHFEIWSLSGQQRVVSPTIGFSLWRVDGTAAIYGSLLIDPNTGATSQLPGGAFKIVDVVAF